MFSGVATIGGRDVSRQNYTLNRRGTAKRQAESNEHEEFYDNLEKEWKGDWLDYYGHKINFEEAEKELDNLAKRQKSDLQGGSENQAIGPETIKELLDEQISRKEAANQQSLRRFEPQTPVRQNEIHIQMLPSMSRPSTATTRIGGQPVFREGESVDLSSTQSMTVGAHRGSINSLDFENTLPLDGSFRDESHNAIRIRRGFDENVANDPEILNRFKTAKKLDSISVVSSR